MFLCLTEVGANADSVKYLHVNKFDLSAYYCRSDFKGGGVGIWTKNSLNVSTIDLSKFCQDKHIEVCAVKINSDKYAGTVILNCYRSPCGNVKIFFDNITNVLDILFKTKINLIVCGDFNLDSIKGNADFNQLHDLFLSFNLKPIVRWPTRVTATTISLIDHIFTNISDFGSCCVTDNIISDHRTVLFQIDTKMNGKIDSASYTYKRSFNDEALDNFSILLSEQDWTQLYNLDNVDVAFDYFLKIFLLHFNNSFPSKLRLDRRKTKNRWFNDQLRISSLKLKDLHKLRQQHPDLKDVYIQAKQNHIKLLNSVKKNFYQKQIMSSDNPSKSAWQVISELSGKNKKQNNFTISHEGKQIQDPNVIASTFNSFFKEAPFNVIKLLTPHATGIYPNTYSSNGTTMFLTPTSSEEIMYIVRRKIKNKWTAGPDEVPFIIFKRVAHIIIQPLVYLVNLTFSAGQFPSNLKSSKIIPVLKKGNVQLLDNYRPIAVSSVFSKLLEYVFLEKLSNFLKINNIITSNQHGFVSGKSTATAINSLYERILSGVDAGECPVGIFCDLSRAFDCVDPKILCKKLNEYGIRGPPLEWIMSFLNNRQQFVSITYKNINNTEKVNSESINIGLGVPQGSVLGPLLFVIYINDLNNLNMCSHTTMYADDTSLVISEKTQDELELRCNNVLATLNDWFSQNNLYFNCNKTHSIIFHNRQKAVADLRLKINNQSIVNSECVKFLGLDIDNNMTWNHHCNHICSKLSSILYQFRSLKNVLTTRQLVNLYYAQVDSRLRYGVCFWGDSSRSSQVFIAQKKIIRCMAGVHSSYPCRDLFKRFGILTLTSLFIFELCLYIFKNKSKFSLNSSIHQFATRQRLDFHVPVSRLSVVMNSPNYVGLRIYNFLPVHIKLCERTNSFKKMLRYYLVDKNYYSLAEYFTANNLVTSQF